MRKYRIVKNVVYILMAFCFYVDVKILQNTPQNVKKVLRKRKLKFYGLAGRLSVLSDGSLAEVDLTHANDGYICARLLQETSGIKLQISKDDKKYNYDLKTTEFKPFPMNMDNGSYTIKILQQIEGTRYAICASNTIDVQLPNDLVPYLYPNQIVDYTKDSYVYKKIF